MDVESIVEQCYNRLPDEWKRQPWNVTDHGRKNLQSEQELDAYLAAYGEMHITKCRAAIQNFPWRNSTDDIRCHNFEIFDWGCGQGIATLTLLEFLEQRELLGHLNSITLIEPSHIALERAKRWVSQNAGTAVKINVVEKFIPDDINGNMDEITCNSAVSINLFSNVLDIRSINLQWLAHKTASLANVNYMVCIGPKFTNDTRIKDFCAYFNPSAFFSDIESCCYGYTKKTHHPYTCETKCFVHRKKDQLNDGYVEKANESIEGDDYDYSVACLKDIVKNDSALCFYNKVKRECSNQFNIFIRPNIGIDTVDALMTNISRGIILINICYEISELEENFKRVENIKSYIFNMHLKTIKIDSIINKGVYGCVKLALYFPKAKKHEVEEQINKIQSNRENIGPTERKGYDYLIQLYPTDNFKEVFEHTHTNSLRYDYIDELVKIIVGHWHPYTDGNMNFHLTDRQKEIVRSNNIKLRVKGVAGCGKTQIVANRAVERHLQTGDKVLILTFNVSLIQYIRMRINQVPADFSTSKFEITNYHQFFISMANKYFGGSISLIDFDNPDFFKSLNDQIEKYKTIVIDEVQDFKTEWLTSIIKYFLAEDGTISIFGDGEQNIYSREVEEETKMPSIPTFSGRWNEMSERFSMRILNEEIASLAHRFAKVFIDDTIPALNIQNNLFGTYYMRYWNISPDTKVSVLCRNIRWILQEYHLNPRNVVVMAESINVLRDFESSYTRTEHKKCMTNFETAEQYDRLIHIQNSPSLLLKDLKDIRRAAKTHFTTDTNDLKLSTIHSFKGWESESVILIIQPEMCSNDKYEGYYIPERKNIPALIYTALTRAKCNLFILNVGNTKYHSFFQTNIR